MVSDLFLQAEIFAQLFLAVILGAFVGLEREYRKKEAGLRTYSLVCLGAALFTIIGVESIKIFGGSSMNFDPSRVVGQIVLGVGFLGAGLIIFKQGHIEGLTTAAGLWVTAAVGAAVGFRLYFLAILATVISVVILAGVKMIENMFFEDKPQDF